MRCELTGAKPRNCYTIIRGAGKAAVIGDPRFVIGALSRISEQILDLLLW